MSAPITHSTFNVDPSRLASGTWCHTRERQIGEGDIAASYSADTIGLEGRVRSPFLWQNTQWVCVSLSSYSHEGRAEAYQLLPARFFDGTPNSYHENALLRDEARQRPEGFYHGMAVKRGKNKLVLIGPPAVFKPSEEAQAPQQTDFFSDL